MSVVQRWHTLPPDPIWKPPPQEPIVLEKLVDANDIFYRKIQNIGLDTAFIRSILSNFDGFMSKVLNACREPLWDSEHVIREDFKAVYPDEPVPRAIRVVMARLMSLGEIKHRIRMADMDPDVFLKPTVEQAVWGTDCNGNPNYYKFDMNAITHHIGIRPSAGSLRYKPPRRPGESIVAGTGLDPVHLSGIQVEMDSPSRKESWGAVSQRMACCAEHVGQSEGCWISLVPGQMWGMPIPYVLVTKDHWEDLSKDVKLPDFIPQVGTAFKDADLYGGWHAQIQENWEILAPEITAVYLAYVNRLDDQVADGKPLSFDPFDLIPDKYISLVVATVKLLFLYNEVYCMDSVMPSERDFVNSEWFKVHSMPQYWTEETRGGLKLSDKIRLKNLNGTRMATAVELKKFDDDIQRVPTALITFPTLGIVQAEVRLLMTHIGKMTKIAPDVERATAILQRYPAQKRPRKLIEIVEAWNTAVEDTAAYQHEINVQLKVLRNKGIVTKIDLRVNIPAPDRNQLEVWEAAIDKSEILRDARKMDVQIDLPKAVQNLVDSAIAMPVTVDIPVLDRESLLELEKERVRLVASAKIFEETLKRDVNLARKEGGIVSVIAGLRDTSGKADALAEVTVTYETATKNVKNDAETLIKIKGNANATLLRIAADYVAKVTEKKTAAIKQLEISLQAPSNLKRLLLADELKTIPGMDQYVVNYNKRVEALGRLYIDVPKDKRAGYDLVWKTSLYDKAKDLLNALKTLITTPNDVNQRAVLGMLDTAEAAIIAENNKYETPEEKRAREAEEARKKAEQEAKEKVAREEKERKKLADEAEAAKKTQETLTAAKTSEEWEEAVLVEYELRPDSSSSPWDPRPWNKSVDKETMVRAWNVAQRGGTLDEFNRSDLLNNMASLYASRFTRLRKNTTFVLLAKECSFIGDNGLVPGGARGDATADDHAATYQNLIWIQMWTNPTRRLPLVYAFIQLYRYMLFSGENAFLQRTIGLALVAAHNPVMDIPVPAEHQPRERYTLKKSERAARDANALGLPPIPTAGSPLIVAGDHTYDASSCPYDSLFAAVFKLPQSKMQQLMANANVVFPLRATKCLDADVGKLVADIFLDISIVQRTTDGGICHSRPGWASCLQGNAVSAQGDPRELFTNLVTFYGLSENVKVVTLLGIAPTPDPLVTTPNTNAIMFSDVSNTRATPVNMPLKFDNFMLVSCLSFQTIVGHWISHVRDPREHQWWKFDPYNNQLGGRGPPIRHQLSNAEGGFNDVPAIVNSPDTKAWFYVLMDPAWEIGPKPVVQKKSVGLTNLGNTCYQNASLQCLFRAGEFSYLIQKYDGSNDMIRQLGVLFGALSSAADVLFYPGDFVSSLQPPFNDPSKQQDAHEFVMHLLGNVGDSSKDKDLESEPNQHVLKQAIGTWAGKERSTLTYPLCKINRTKTDEMIQLQVAIPSGIDEITLSDCILYTFKPENMDKDFKFDKDDACPPGSVPDPTQVERVRAIEEEPDILLLHLKRFNEVRDTAGNFTGYTKNSTRVTFTDILDVPVYNKGSIKFRLFGITYHNGDNPRHGHYIAYCSRKSISGDDTWELIDDGHVHEPVSFSTVMARDVSNSMPYMLFYERVDKKRVYQTALGLINMAPPLTEAHKQYPGFLENLGNLEAPDAFSNNQGRIFFLQNLRKIKAADRTAKVLAEVTNFIPVPDMESLQRFKQNDPKFDQALQWLQTGTPFEKTEGRIHFEQTRQLRK